MTTKKKVTKKATVKKKKVTKKPAVKKHIVHRLAEKYGLKVIDENSAIMF